MPQAKPLPRIQRRRSKLHGWGVFALEPITKNTRIIDYDGELIDHKESLKRETKYLKRGEIWCFTVNRRWVRDANAGGNVLVGRQLYPLLRAAGYRGVRAEPRVVYVDGSRPGLADAFTRKTFAAMIRGVRAPALEAGIIDRGTFDAGVRALERAAAPDGVFCYTFFRAVGVVPGRRARGAAEARSRRRAR